MYRGKGVLSVFENEYLYLKQTFVCVQPIAPKFWVSVGVLFSILQIFPVKTPSNMSLVNSK